MTEQITLEQYLELSAQRGVIDHNLRANVGQDGKVTFYIHPRDVDGNTLDYVVRGNELAPSVTSDSDVPGYGQETGDEQMRQVAGCVGSSYQPSPTEDAVRLGHCAASVADSLGSLLDRLSIDSAPAKALAGLVKTLADRAEAALGTIAVAGPVQITTIGDIELHTTGSVSVERHP